MNPNLPNSFWQNLKSTIARIQVTAAYLIFSLIPAAQHHTLAYCLQQNTHTHKQTHLLFRSVSQSNSCC